MKEMMDEKEAWQLWRYTTYATKLSFQEFKDNLMKHGIVIYHVESEGIPRERKRKKNKT